MCVLFLYGASVSLVVWQVTLVFLSGLTLSLTAQCTFGERRCVSIHRTIIIVRAGELNVSYMYICEEGKSEYSTPTASISSL